MAAASLAFTAHGATLQTKFEFTPDTPLAEGHWVKFSIDRTGIYEITYDQLREMGFDDPSKVALYGTGGKILSYNFLDNSGKRLYSDALNPAAVLHTGEKMIFYCLGPEQINVSTTGYSSTKRMKHNRTAKNIYSDSSWYLLSDNGTPAAPASNPVPDKSGAYDMTVGYGYVYHEKDAVYNFYQDGQVFWGEELRGGQKISFEVERPYCVDAPAYLWLGFASLASDGTVTSALNNEETSASLAGLTPGIYNIGNSLDRARLNVDADGTGKGTVTFGVSSSYSFYPLGIDFWTLTYPISLELAREDAGFTSQYIAFMDTPYDRWRHPVPEGCVAWDITGGQNPKVLDIEDGYLYNNRTGLSQAVVFRPDREQMHVNPDWKVIGNQNLHALQNEACSMVIVTVPSLREYAERIARLHEEYDGQKVVVVTPDEVYNEFNHGTPDVTAIRAFIKMIYHRQRETLKNVLLVGNVFADHRNVAGNPDRPETIPVYMLPKATIEYSKGAGGSACIDYLGILTDYMNSTGLLNNTTVELGVGILPITSAEEGETAVAKIGAYLAKKDFSNVVNEFQSMSGTGDNHIHDFQAFRLANLFREYTQASAGSDAAVSTRWLKGTGEARGRAEFLSKIRGGKLLSSFYGHARNAEFANITPWMLTSLDCDEPAFLYVAGCDLTEPDRGRHGVGDLGVIRNRKGIMATICGTRNVLSHENQMLSENFMHSLFYGRDQNLRKSTPTIGEVYALAKERTNNESEQGYILIGDPALPMPVALRNVEVATDRTDYRGGEVMEVSGTVRDRDGRADEAYNGYVTLKLLEPYTESAITADPVKENGEPDTPNPRLQINDLRLATSKAEVKDGRFKARILLPESLDQYLSRPDSTYQLMLLAGAYDPDRRIGASGNTKVVMPMIGSEPSPSPLRDTQAPAVSVSYDNLQRCIEVTASGDTGLYPGIGKGRGITLDIDGNPCTLAHDGALDIPSAFFYGTLSTAHLPAGVHKVNFKATDAAGNSTPVNTFSFEVKDFAPLSLTAESEVVTDRLALRIDRNDGLTLTLVIADRHGKVVHCDAFDGSAATVDLEDLAPGTYRASVRHDSKLGAMIHSNWVEFTKID